MRVERLADYSRIMAVATMVLIVGMLLLNIACWAYPSLASTYGLGFSLTSQIASDSLRVGIADMPWWQVAGSMLLSSIPLLILARGLNALRLLFQSYGAGEYFSLESAVLLGNMGRDVALWVLASFLVEPVLSVWLTLLHPQHSLTLTFQAPGLVALFLAAAIMLIARILYKASLLAHENQQFV